MITASHYFLRCRNFFYESHVDGGPIQKGLSSVTVFSLFAEFLDCGFGIATRPAEVVFVFVTAPVVVGRTASATARRSRCRASSHSDKECNSKVCQLLPVCCRAVVELVVEQLQNLFGNVEALFFAVVFKRIRGCAGTVLRIIYKCRVILMSKYIPDN